jgi:acid stress-induced BolA-like protein IbaG/YrbA
MVDRFGLSDVRNRDFSVVHSHVTLYTSRFGTICWISAFFLFLSSPPPFPLPEVTTTSHCRYYPYLYTVPVSSTHHPRLQSPLKPLLDQHSTERNDTAFSMKLVRSIVAIFFMWTTASRAFRPVVRVAWARNTATRQFSTANGPDTTIVQTCQQKIQDALSATDVKVTGAYDDPNGSHISIEVVAEAFAGKRPVQRQQMVYKAIWEELKGPVHAVDAMICKTPDEV